VKTVSQTPEYEYLKGYAIITDAADPCLTGCNYRLTPGSIVRLVRKARHTEVGRPGVWIKTIDGRGLFLLYEGEYEVVKDEEQIAVAMLDVLGRLGG
jgi:hypothetical protein